MIESDTIEVLTSNFQGKKKINKGNKQQKKRTSKMKTKIGNYKGLKNVKEKAKGNDPCLRFYKESFTIKELFDTRAD